MVNRLMADPARCPTSPPRCRQPAARCAVLQRLPDAMPSARSGQDSHSRSQSRCPQQLDTDARWRKRLTATPAHQILPTLGASSIVLALSSDLLDGVMTDDTSLRT
jgi:hypothetical protein